MLIEKNTTSVNGLLIFVVGLIGFLAALDILVRNNQGIFEGASHRMLAKLATYERKSKVDYLFFGTSRTQDGIAPRLVSDHLQEISPEFNDLVGFNAAAPGESIDDLIALAPRYLDKPGLRVVFIELSGPHFSNEPTLPATSKASPATVEAGLAAFLQNLYVIKYRTAFRPGNLGSIVSLLLFSSSMSGSESRLNDYLAAWMGKHESLPENFNENLWLPDIILPQKTIASSNEETNKTAEKIVKLSNLFQENGIKVIYLVPPATSAYLPERESLASLYQVLARRSKAETWNFITLPIPNHFFKDPTHLSKNEGQPHWSYAIASQLAKVLQAR